MSDCIQHVCPELFTAVTAVCWLSMTRFSLESWIHQIKWFNPRRADAVCVILPLQSGATCDLFLIIGGIIKKQWFPKKAKVLTLKLFLIPSLYLLQWLRSQRFKVLVKVDNSIKLFSKKGRGGVCLRIQSGKIWSIFVSVCWCCSETILLIINIFC